MGDRRRVGSGMLERASELAGNNSRWGKRAGWAVLGAKRMFS